MKKFFLIILCCFVCGMSISFATDNNTLINTNRRNGSNRPHVPDRQVITCVYSDGDICLDFVYSEGMCDVYVADACTGETQYFSFDSAELSVLIYVGEIGESYITLVTEKGNTYEGVILVDDPE